MKNGFGAGYLGGETCRRVSEHVNLWRWFFAPKQRDSCWFPFTDSESGFAPTGSAWCGRRRVMCDGKCNCAFRLFHLNASMSEGGAVNSVTGVPLGSGKRKANTQEDTMAAYLGNSTNRGALPDELRNDEVELGFAKDADLKVQMPSQHIRHIVRATWFQDTQ